MESQNVTVVLAFGAGVLTFLSPCVLPLVPIYLSYLTGSTSKSLTKGMRLGDRASVLSRPQTEQG